MPIENSKPAQEYLDYLNPDSREQTQFDHMTDMITSLQEAVGRVGGNPAMFNATQLSQMTALDLIATLAPNEVRFTAMSTATGDVWKDAPYWANYLAMDADQEWHWYEVKPILDVNEREWQHSDHHYRVEPLDDYELRFVPKARDWTTSLVSNPNRFL